MIRRITAVTGSRAEYDLLQPVLQLLENDREFELEVIATGAHLSREFGSTVEAVRQDGYSRLTELPTLPAWDDPAARLQNIATQLGALGVHLSRNRPELLMVLGDREEPLTTAVAGTYLGIPVAHIFGGDSGWSTADDHVRHAVSKLAHLHFTATERSARNLESLGEDPERIFVTGNPGLDRLRQTPHWSRERLWRELDFHPGGAPVVLVIFHPLESQREKAGAQMAELLEGVLRQDAAVLINYPNSDAGNYAVRRVLDRYVRKYSPRTLRVFRYLPRQIYVNLLRRVDCLVGNSSSGILEAPFLKLPAVNVGLRQADREHAGNVVFVPPRAAAVSLALAEALQRKKRPDFGVEWQYRFGDGHAAEKIVNALRRLSVRSLWPKTQLVGMVHAN
jgi:GDP/UDP-N,N'-diacetylbacillosamine 2-epimerase (hydrolysing)